MELCHPHNLSRPVVPEAPRPFGIRVSLHADDPFVRLVGRDWQQMHWYASHEERDRALAEMSRRHEFSRRSDAPRLRFEAVEREPAQSA